MVRVLILTVLVGQLAGVAVASAQDPAAPNLALPRWMVGYVANAPHQFLGGAVAVLPRRLAGWGFYADAKTSTQSPADDESYIRDLTREEAETQFGDAFLNERNVWLSFNFAVIRAFQQDAVLLYAGGGASHQSPFAEFFDASGERGVFGHYWVSDPGREAWRPNLMAGMFSRVARRVVIQIGVETMPRGVTVGTLAVF